jgi:hypothetical protein
MKVKLLTVAVSAMLAAGLSQTVAAAPVASSVPAALTTALANNPIVLNLAGSSAQDKGIAFILGTDVAAVPGSLVVIKDNYGGTTTSSSNWGGRWTTYVAHTGTTSTTTGQALPAALQNKYIIVNKRSAGGSGYGVLPLANDPAVPAPFAVNFLDYNNLTNIYVDGGVYGVDASEPTYANGGGTVAGTHTLAAIPDAGVSDINPDLYYGVNTVLDFGVPVNSIDIGTLNVTPAVALTFGIVVTTDLFNALQAAQGLTVSTNYGTASGLDDLTPSLSSAQVAALLSGKVKTWDELSFNGGATSLVSAAAGKVATPGDNLVHLLFRGAGSGTAAQAYARFLNSPAIPNATSPATADNRAAGGPALNFLLETVDEEQALDDLQNGTSIAKDGTTGLAVNAGKKAWGIGYISADKNALKNGAYGRGYRFIKIDGYTPSLTNVYNGNYSDWAESSWITSKTNVSGSSAGTQALVKYLTEQATSAAVIGLSGANSTQDFAPKNAAITVNGASYTPGNAGYAAIVGNAKPANAQPSSLNFAAPVIPYLYPNGDNAAKAVPASVGAVLNFKSPTFAANSTN